RFATGLSSQFADFADGLAAARLLACLAESAALGALIGWERSATGKAAGLRTHMLLCVGAAFVTVMPILAGMDSADVSRILQGLMAGVGFLGAGSILKREDAGRIAGLTTAAGLWLTAGVGMAVGLGQGVSAAVCGVLAFAILWVLGRLEYGTARPPGSPQP